MWKYSTGRRVQTVRVASGSKFLIGSDYHKAWASRLNWLDADAGACCFVIQAVSGYWVKTRGIIRS
jgi:hypothetical protein